MTEKRNCAQQYSPLFLSELITVTPLIFQLKKTPIIQNYRLSFFQKPEHSPSFAGERCSFIFYD